MRSFDKSMIKIKLLIKIVVYFDQQTDAGQNQFLTLKQLFPSLTKENKEKRKQSCTKTWNKRGVYQHLGVTLKPWLTPKSWWTPEVNV